MTCRSCNKEIPENAVFCPECGARTQEGAAQQAPPPVQQPYTPPAYQPPPYQQASPQYPNQYPSQYPNQYPPPYPPPYYQEPDIPNTGMNVLGFLFPIVALILYFSWKDRTPIKAKAVGKWGIIGACVNFALIILFIIIGVAAASSGPSYGWLL